MDDIFLLLANIICPFEITILSLFHYQPLKR